MNFIDAIKICFNKYADFNGCANETEFWWWVLFTFLGSAVLRTVNFQLSGLFSIATILPSIAVGARRLHDTDRSGWLRSRADSNYWVDHSDHMVRRKGETESVCCGARGAHESVAARATARSSDER